MQNNMQRKLIIDIIDDNYVNAYVLYFFGINFFNYSDKTLEQVCQERGLNVLQVVKNLESIQSNSSVENISLHAYGVDIIIEYLKHNHYLFIKQKLPYIARLINEMKSDKKKIVSDLKLIFPYFVEDFIKHIYEEEDTLFKYILTLHKALTAETGISNLYMAMESHSIREFAIEHTSNDDDMKGIRELTNNYHIDDPYNIHLKVVYAELKSFEADLVTHAKIENEILFPKAFGLENEASLLLKNKSGQN